MPGDPRGVAIGADGTVYVGLAAIAGRHRDRSRRPARSGSRSSSTPPRSRRRKSWSRCARIADRTRLYIANGSDESATDPLAPRPRRPPRDHDGRRDDPRRRPRSEGPLRLLLGRRVHVFDDERRHGTAHARRSTIRWRSPRARTARRSRSSRPRTSATRRRPRWRCSTRRRSREIAREPLQTQKTIEAAMFADRRPRAVAFSRDSLFEKAGVSRPARRSPRAPTAHAMTHRLRRLVNSDRVCLPEGSGPQIATLARHRHARSSTPSAAAARAARSPARAARHAGVAVRRQRVRHRVRRDDNARRHGSRGISHGLQRARGRDVLTLSERSESKGQRPALHAHRGPDAPHISHAQLREGVADTHSLQSAQMPAGRSAFVICAMLVAVALQTADRCGFLGTRWLGRRPRRARFMKPIDLACGSSWSASEIHFGKAFLSSGPSQILRPGRNTRRKQRVRFKGERAFPLGHDQWSQGRGRRLSRQRQSDRAATAARGRLSL